MIAGKDKNKTGVIVKSMPSTGQVIVEGVNVFKKHKKATQAGKSGQVVEVTLPIFVNKVKKI